MHDYSTLLDIVLLSLLLVTGITAVVTRNLLTSTIVLSVFSLLMAVLYAVMGAPDVAMTEAAVGAGISTLLLLAALVFIGEKEGPSTPRAKWLALAAVVPTLALLLYATIDMPPYGSADAPAHKYVAPYYIEKVKTDIGIPNQVTAVLASYRGFDTLGETVVIMTAGLSVLLLLGNAPKKSKKE